MKYLFLFILAPIFCVSQELRILSSKDKKPVPFAFITIKSNSGTVQKTTDAGGKADLGNNFIDTVSYLINIKSIGFFLYSKSVTGDELKRLLIVEVEPENLQLDEVVITAQYAPTLAESSVQRIKIIDKDKIEKMGAVNLRDVLSNQMNVRLQQDNILGSSLNLQGISGENVKILMDGVPLIGRLNGNIDLSQINMNNVERIEIVEGPLSVQYGTNALAGTINIITKKGTKDTQTIGLSSYYESIGTYNLTGDITFSRKHHHVQLSGGRNYFDGWNGTDALFELPESRIADSSRFKQWKPKEQYFGTLAYQYKFKKMIAGIKSAYFNEKIINRGYPLKPYSEIAFDDYYFTKRFDNSADLNGNISRSWRLTSVSSYNYYERIKKTVYKDLTTLNEQTSANSPDQDTSRYTLLMSRASFIHSNDSAQLNYEIGYDVNYESGLGKRIERHLRIMGDYALFTTAEYKPIKEITLKPGLRYAYNTGYNSPLVPSLNVKWNVSARHTLRASYAKGFRAPTIKELYFYFVDINHNIVGNEELKAENSDNSSLSYNFNAPIKRISYKFDANIFYNDIRNMITLAPTNSTEYSYVNIGRYKTLGFQLSNTVVYKGFSINTGFNYTGRYNELSATNKIPGFSYSPEVVLNTSYQFKKQKTTLSVFYKYNGRLPSYALTNGVLEQSFISDYKIMDASIVKQFFSNKISLVLGCKNLFDIKNIASKLAAAGAHSSASSSVAFSTGRNYFIRLAFNL